MIKLNVLHSESLLHEAFLTKVICYGSGTLNQARYKVEKKFQFHHYVSFSLKSCLFHCAGRTMNTIGRLVLLGKNLLTMYIIANENPFLKLLKEVDIGNRIVGAKESFRRDYEHTKNL